MLKMTGNGGTSQACAACKYQRRKCTPECPLAPYFPPDQPKQFLNAHKLFGVSNILRILKQLDDSQKSDAMKSIVYQANAREKDPVHGCVGIIMLLQSQINRLKEELDLVRNQVTFLKQLQQQNNLPVLQPEQQFQPQIGSAGGVSHGSHALPVSWIHPFHVVHQPCGAVFDAHGQGPYRQCSDSEADKLLEYDQRCSAESSLKEMESLEQASVHELKSAAALFPLTASQH